MRICARSGCSSPAAAILTYDREAQIAYLYSVDDPSTRTPGDLCARHLARFVLPRHWQLDDRRDESGEVEPDAAPVPATKRRERLRAVPNPDAGTSSRRKWTEVVPSLFDAPVNETVANTATDIEADEPTGPVWMPRFGPDSELDGVLDAKTPLLKRAFGGS
jgi:Protein of unknown function (DUF3499)